MVISSNVIPTQCLRHTEINVTLQSIFIHTCTFYFTMNHKKTCFLIKYGQLCKVKLRFFFIFFFLFYSVFLNFNFFFIFFSSSSFRHLFFRLFLFFVFFIFLFLIFPSSSSPLPSFPSVSSIYLSSSLVPSLFHFLHLGPHFILLHLPRLFIYFVILFFPPSSSYTSSLLHKKLLCSIYLQIYIRINNFAHSYKPRYEFMTHPISIITNSISSLIAEE